MERELSPLARMAEDIGGMLWAMSEPSERQEPPRSHRAEVACIAIAQTDRGLTAYLGRAAEKTEGVRYLLTVGALQALFVQQDAVRDLFEALGKSAPLKGHPTFHKARDFRNAAVGHPSKQDRGHDRAKFVVTARAQIEELKKLDRGRLIAYNYLLVHPVNSDRVMVNRNFSSGHIGFLDARLSDLIADQRAMIAPVLEELRREVTTIWESKDYEDLYGPPQQGPTDEPG